MKFFTIKTNIFKQILLLLALFLFSAGNMKAQSAMLPYEETFNEGLGDWYAYSVAGDTVWKKSKEKMFWIEEGETEIKSAYTAEMLKYGSTPDEEDWLISPVFTASEGSGIGLRFYSYYSGSGNKLTVKYSTDYSGAGDPHVATWTDISDKVSWGSFSETKESGNIIIAESLPLRIAFVYTGNNANCNVWNVKVDNTDAIAPSTPANLMASATEAGILLAWDASTDNTDVTGYHIYVNGSLLASPTDTTYTISHIPVNTEYTIDVDAYDEAGNTSEKTTITYLFPSQKPNSQCDYSDDFTSLDFVGSRFNSTSIQTSLITPDNWTCENVVMVKGPDEGEASSTSLTTEYRAMETGEQGICINGIVGAEGVITSPILSGGCQNLFFNYSTRSKNIRQIQIIIKQENDTVWSDTLDITVYSTHTKCEYIRKDINITGDFQLEIKNLCSSGSTNANRVTDDVTIWNTCIQTPVTEVATPEIAIEGKQKSENTYWEETDITLSTETRDCNIYYTIDGSEPASESILYTDPFTITETATVKAIAIYDNLQSTIANKLISIAGPQTATLPYDESFASDLSDWYSYNTIGEQEWGAGTEGENTFAQMWGAPDEYTVVANEDWFISPAFTADEGYGLALSFSSLKQYDGNAIALKYSTDYAGVGDPSTGTWTDISDKAVLPTSEATWTSSGDIKVDETQAVRFAFVYTSTASEAAIWQIANVHAENKDVTAPSIPTALTGTPAETTIALSWTAATDNVGVTGYNVYVNDDLDGTTTGTDYSITSLNAATEYQVSVEAMDDAGNKSVKTSTTVSTTDETAPGTPADLTGTPAETTIALSWTAATDNVGVTGYNVYIDDDLDGTTTGTDYSITSLNAATEYQVSVEAVDDAGNKSVKASATVSTTDETAPGTPTDLAGTPAETTIVLSWTAATDNVGVTGYNVYVGDDLDGTTTGTDYSITSLNAATEYQVSVEAVDAAGNKSVKASATVSTTDETAPGTPTDLAGTPAETTIALSWTAATDNVGVTGYNVYVDDDLDGTTTGTDYSITSLNAATEYQVSVEAVDAAGNKSVKATVTQSTLTSTGVSYANKNDISVHPNPFNSYIVLETTRDDYVTIYDVSGNLILQANIKSGINHINTSELEKGMYILKYGSNTVKIMK